MVGSLYYRQQTASQSIYYTMRSIGATTFKICPDLKDIFDGEYLYPINIIKEFIPFTTLRPSDTVLHVGFDRTYLDKGMSHPLIEAAIVGEKGMVRCIDPDRRNINALNNFAESYHLAQLKAIKGAAWNCNKKLEFAYDSNWGPMSGALTIPEQRKYSSQQSGNQLETVQARPLDEFIPEIFGNRPLDFLALTVNGAESEVLEGAKKTLVSNPHLRIGMALSFKHFSFEIRKKICDKLMSEGWNVVVSNSPHDPWNSNVFLWCCIVRESEKFMEEIGAIPVDWSIAAELALNESLLVKKRADQIRLHIRKEFFILKVAKYGLKKVKCEIKKMTKQAFADRM